MARIAERFKTLEHPQFGKLTNVKKAQPSEKPAGQWNTLEMTARGKTLTLWVNGAVTCQFRDCGL